MVGAFLTVAVLAQMGGVPERSYPDEMLGLMPRFAGGMLVGSGTDQIANPVFGWGGSLQIRLLEGIYLDISGDSRIPASAEEKAGTILMGVDQQFAGIRVRQAIGPASNLVFGAGGGAFAYVDYGGGSNQRIDTGPAAYGMTGFERKVHGSEGSGSYFGFEVSYTHHFSTDDSPFHGGLLEGRLTFSYYFGGSEAADCM